METYYQVTYITENELKVIYKRDTVERGYYLYKSLEEDGIENIKLEEISNSGVALLRGNGMYKPQPEIKQETVLQLSLKSKPKDWFEMVWGISKEEYNECINRWNRLTGENNELL